MSRFQENAEHAWTDDSVRLILTPSHFARTSLFHTQEVGHFITLPTYYTERKRLNSFLIVYTMSGRGKLTYGQQTYVLQKGHVFFIDCMEYQYYAAEKNWAFAWAHVNGPALRAQYDFYAGRGGPVRMTADGSRIPLLLRELLTLHGTRSIRSELLASRMIGDLLTELMLQSADEGRAEQEMPVFIGEAMRYIERYVADRLTLDRLAREFAIGKYTFAKSFKLHTGFSPGEYIITTRISKAKELLKYSKLTVAEIAELVGIDNVSHFINLFRDRVELTPYAFRKTWQRPHV
jgi:AraC-like DNA-binding protein